MTLQEYFAQEKSLSRVELAAKAGITNSFLGHIMSERRVPSPSTAKAIIEATGGLVTYEDLYGVPAIADTPAVEERVSG